MSRKTPKHPKGGYVCPVPDAARWPQYSHLSRATCGFLNGDKRTCRRGRGMWRCWMANHLPNTGISNSERTA